MLTLVKTKDAVAIVGIYRGTKNKKPENTVYFTHDMDKDKQNVAPAAGVLHLHKSSLKKEFHLNDADFAEVWATRSSRSTGRFWSATTRTCSARCSSATTRRRASRSTCRGTARPGREP